MEDTTESSSGYHDVFQFDNRHCCDANATWLPSCLLSLIADEKCSVNFVSLNPTILEPFLSSIDMDVPLSSKSDPSSAEAKVSDEADVKNDCIDASGIIILLIAVIIIV